MLKKGELGFHAAKEKVGHPIEFDHLSAFTFRLLHQHSYHHLSDPDSDPRLLDAADAQHPPYHKAVIFVDNSGADIILGVLPFARYLLKRRCAVVLAANTRPAVNDVTAYELEEIVSVLGTEDVILKEALEKGKLLVVGTGSMSPCLGIFLFVFSFVSQCVFV